jgi:hypothetical protein
MGPVDPAVGGYARVEVSRCPVAGTTRWQPTGDGVHARPTPGVGRRQERHPHPRSPRPGRCVQLDRGALHDASAPRRGAGQAERDRIERRFKGARAEPYCFVHAPQPSEVNPLSEAGIVTIGVVVPKSFAMMSLDWPEKPDTLSQ